MHHPIDNQNAFKSFQFHSWIPLSVRELELSYVIYYSANAFNVEV
jgi:hypothetical protein